MIKKFIALVLVTGAFITLCLLGHWQLERAQWKNEIITQLESEYAKDPMQHRLRFDDLKNTNIQHGSLRGKFDYSKQMLFGPKKNPDRSSEEIGFDVLIPMQLKQGSVLVNMGWVQGENREEIETPAPRGFIVLTGIARAPDWNKFTPNNSPEHNIWTKLDIEQIADSQNIQPIAHAIFYARSASVPFKDFKMMEENWFPRNKHIQYAIFWFSMAGILLILVGIFFLKNRKTSKI